MTILPFFCSRQRWGGPTAYCRLSLHSLAVSVLLASYPTLARDYFDPGFLGVLGDKITVDLSAFNEPGGVEEGRYPVTVMINQREAGQFTLEFKKNAQGKVVPKLTPDLLDTLGVNVSQVPSLKNLPRDQPVDDLTALIPQASTPWTWRSCG